MFSVIIPLFNKAPYLQRALDSVLAQTGPDDEVIVVNDGSTDGGEKLAKARADRRIRVIDQGNQGVSAARNAGLAAASQPFVAFLDADDAWLPGYLDCVREMIKACPGAALYGTGFATVVAGREIRRYGVRLRDVGDGFDSGPLSGGGRIGPAFGPVDFFKVWSRGHVIHTSSTVVPIEAARAVGGFPLGITHCEDHEFWAKLALSGTVIISSNVLTHYDVGVPGQAVEYWSKGYRRTLEVLPYHRFLARRYAEMGKTLPSFASYCRKELRIGLLQRIYRGHFDAATAYVRELGLDSGEWGWMTGLGAWLVLHPFLHPVVGAAMKLVRLLRKSGDASSPQAGEDPHRS